MKSFLALTLLSLVNFSCASPIGPGERQNGSNSLGSLLGSFLELGALVATASNPQQYHEETGVRIQSAASNFVGSAVRLANPQLSAQGVEATERATGLFFQSIFRARLDRERTEEILGSARSLVNVSLSAANASEPTRAVVEAFVMPYLYTRNDSNNSGSEMSFNNLTASLMQSINETATAANSTEALVRISRTVVPNMRAIAREMVRSLASRIANHTVNNTQILSGPEVIIMDAEVGSEIEEGLVYPDDFTFEVNDDEDNEEDHDDDEESDDEHSETTAVHDIPLR